MMTTEDQIRDEKLQYDIRREDAKISALSSGKIDKYEYLTGEQILPSSQQQIIEQAKFTYSSLGKGFLEQTKTIKDQGEKQIDAKTKRNKTKREKTNEYSYYFLNGLAEIRKSFEPVNFYHLTYNFKDSNIASVSLCNITLEDVEKDKKKT